MSVKTKSELIFDDFLRANSLPFEKIREATSKRPDYLVHFGNLDLIFEVKELDEDEDFGVVNKVYSTILGDHVRGRIDASRKQVQYGANQGIPSILLIYNALDSIFQLTGTSDEDFTAAMYGEFTVLLNARTNEPSELFNGKNQLLQERKNTSFSAVGRLCDWGGRATVTLFENVFAKLAVPYEQLPPCFDVRRVEVSTAPLVVP